jgi:hypothetical protein
MKIMQIVYPGLGGNSAVAFSLVEGQRKNKKINNFFLFCGVEKLIKNYQNKCSILNIQYFYLKKNKYKINTKKIFEIVKKKKPDVIIVHDYNLLPFFIYSLITNIKLIYVHHTPDKTKKIIDWIGYFFNSIFAYKIVLVSKRNKNDFMFKLNRIFFLQKINIIENGINTSKFKR